MAIWLDGWSSFWNGCYPQPVLHYVIRVFRSGTPDVEVMTLPFFSFFVIRPMLKLSL